MSAKDDSGFVSVYTVEIFTREQVAIDKGALLGRLQQRLGAVEAHDGDALMFALTERMVRFENGQIPAQVLVTDVKPSDLAVLAPAIYQTWDWDGARDALGRARHAVLVTDFMASGLPPSERLKCVLETVAAVLELVPAVAIHLRPTQRLLDPKTFAARLAEDPAGVAVNVRLFNIENGRPQEMVMDTLGLAAVGIPDFQVHSVGLDPAKVAGFLYAMSRYVHQRGPVIQDGHTVPGPKLGEKWEVRLETALIEPTRMVLDIDPSPPHSTRVG